MLAAFAFIATAQGYRAQFPLPDLTAPAGWGVNIHFTDPQPGEVDRLREAGFRWVRMDLFWHQIETRRGEYDFSAYDRLMAALKPKGIRPIFILDYGNDLYQTGSPRTPEARRGFANFVAAAVARYRGQGVIWEMWNEPNIHFWNPRPNVDEYIALAKEVQATIRRVAPEEWHVGPATSGFDSGFLRSCFKAGLLTGWDAVTVHPYRSVEPETVGEDWARLRALIDRYAPKGKRIPMLSGEWGYSDVAPGIDRERQAQYAARMYLSNLVHGVPLTILYDWRDDGEEPKEPEHHFGTVTHRELDPKPSYRAIQHLSRELEGFRYHLKLALPNRQDVLLAFRKGGDLKLVAYTTRRTNARVSLPVGAEAAFRRTRPEGVSHLAAGVAAKGLDLTGMPQVLTPTSQSPALALIASLHPLPSFATYADTADAYRRLADAQRRFQAARGPTTFTVFRPGMAPVRLRPSALRDRRLTLGLDPRPTRLRVQTIVPGGAALTQETELRPAQPVAMSPTLGGAGLIVTLDNPEGAALSGALVVRHGAEVREVPFALRADQPSLALPVPGVPLDWLAEGVRLELRQGREVLLRDDGITLTTLPPLARPGAPLAAEYRIELDGDPKTTGRAEGAGRTLADTPGGQTEGLNLRYEFAPGWKFLMLKTTGDARRPLPGRPRALGMWVRGDGSGDILRMRFVDATDQTFQPDYGAIDWTGWRYVTFRLDATASGRWGGANDGVVHYPIAIDSLALVDNKGGGRPSEIWIAGPTLVGTSQRASGNQR